MCRCRCLWRCSTSGASARWRRRRRPRPSSPGTRATSWSRRRPGRPCSSGVSLVTAVCAAQGAMSLPRYTLTNPGPSVAPAAPVQLFLAPEEGILSWDQVSLSSGHNCSKVQGTTPPPATRTSDGETKVTYFCFKHFLPEMDVFHLCRCSPAGVAPALCTPARCPVCPWTRCSRWRRSSPSTRWPPPPPTRGQTSSSSSAPSAPRTSRTEAD